MVTGISDKIVAGDSDVGNSSCVGLDPVVDPQLVADPAHMPAVGSEKSALTLSQVGNSLNHEGFCPGSWVERDLYPEMPSEKMAEDITLRLRMVVGMFRKYP